MSKRIEIEGAPYWAEWLRQWRLWLLGALLGLAAALLFYLLAPPQYRAQATVVVDQNVEQAWTYFPDRQLFQFMRRETDRLVELAWSDQVLAVLTPDFSLAELRAGLLDLSHPADGGWHFSALHPDAATAAELANRWTAAFLDSIALSIDTDPEMQAAREALAALVLQDPAPDDPQLNALLGEIAALAERVDGVSPYVAVSLSQRAQPPTERAVSPASYALAGALGGMFLAFSFTLLRISPSTRDE